MVGTSLLPNLFFVSAPLPLLLGGHKRLLTSSLPAIFFHSYSTHRLPILNFSPTITMARPTSPNTSTPPLAAGFAEAVSYASSHGIVVSQALHAPTGTSLTHAPMTYLPSPLPSACYAHALRITPSLNALISRIAADHDYLRRTLAETAAADAQFTGRLLTMLGVASKEEGVQLALSRFDYFVHHYGGQHLISSAFKSNQPTSNHRSALCVMSVAANHHSSTSVLSTIARFSEVCPCPRPPGQRSRSPVGGRSAQPVRRSGAVQSSP